MEHQITDMLRPSEVETNKKVLYRAYGKTKYGYIANSIVIMYYEFSVLRITPQGFWIYANGEEKWVQRGEGKRFAYTTKQSALNSLIRRRHHYIRILTNKLEHAKETLRLAEKEYLFYDKT